MTLIFVYGTLKSGFPNVATNRGRLAAATATPLDPWPLYLVGERSVPWLINSKGEGVRITGEFYEVDDDALSAMDRLERIDAPDGYRRRTIAVSVEGETREAQVYLKEPDQLSASEIKAGPLAEYTAEQAKLYRSRSRQTDSSVP